MEAFSLLKYWRGGGGGASVTLDAGPTARTAAATKTIVTAVSHDNTAETDEDDNDDGPFFDLEFSVPDEEEQVKHQDDGNDNSADSGEEDGDGDNVDSDATDDENDREFKFTLSSGSSGDRTDPNVSLSPSDDLFFKGRLVPIESSSIVLNSSEPNSKSQFPVSLLKSATRFRVLMLKFKKSKSNATEKTENEKTENDGSTSATPKQQNQQPDQSQQQQQNQPQNKFFTIKFKVEEVPIVSLFTRDNSSRACNKVEKQSSDETISDDKRFSKDVMQRYLKMVKPLYIRVSKRYGEKLKLSGQLSLGSSGGAKPAPSPPSTAPPKSPPVKSTAAKSEPQPPEVSEAPPLNNLKSQKQVNLPAGLRVVCKHLGKSRSASSPAVAPVSVQSNRRDDSLLQQQDGIQSAILHCKRSFNASRDLESSTLSRSVSDPSNEKSLNMANDCSAEEGATRLACV
ncbi:probable membrane-associated kinase regulator 2 [Cornus florida]|uniref:probable membrane-associated kinase regulator 2 n=1 Tax=Cornus florida TaxID=4283 RepID=UPI00289B0381|nr:probable membrane-associated kinase regulator 2 [Cornus florida]